MFEVMLRMCIRHANSKSFTPCPAERVNAKICVCEMLEKEEMSEFSSHASMYTKEYNNTA